MPPIIGGSPASAAISPKRIASWFRAITQQHASSTVTCSADCDCHPSQPGLVALFAGQQRFVAQILANTGMLLKAKRQDDDHDVSLYGRMLALAHGCAGPHVNVVAQLPRALSV